MSLQFGVSNKRQGDALRENQTGVMLRFGLVMLVGAFLIMPGMAHAASMGGGALPWTGTLESIVGFLQGDVAKAISTILVIFLGFLIAFGEIRGFLGLFLRVSFGLSLVFFAGSWLMLFFGH